MVQPFIYRSAAPGAVFADVRRIKGLIDDKMAKRGESERNVKLGTGGIREIEFLVQALQVTFGPKIPAIRLRNTTKALGRLLRAGLISAGEYATLVEAYWFLRDVEHKLQMVEEQQTHTLPSDVREVRLCALRMGYRDSGKGMAEDLFLRGYARHTERVHAVFARVVAGNPAQ
jgi:glutamate-ammonia-ligase adenylyltransferase